MGLDTEYCGAHHQRVIVEGDDPVRLAYCSSFENQCQLTAMIDGANACALLAGHEGWHENHFGSQYRDKLWTDKDTVVSYLMTLYSQPGKKRR